MDHPDWPAFVSAILANPDDDTVRLVAADFLEENGDTDRAAFIRLQCEIARSESTTPLTLEESAPRARQVQELRRKEQRFLGPRSTLRLLWAAEACPELVRVQPLAHGAGLLARPRVEGAERLRWHRGFVEEIGCPAAEWLRHGIAIRSRQPVRVVWLTSCTRTPPDEWYASLAALRGLQTVRVDAYDEDEAGQFADWLRRWLPGTEINNDIPF